MGKNIFAVMVIMMLLAMPVAGMVAAQGDEVTIEWWSHWANEPAKVKVIERIAADYMAEHPNVTIEIIWWDKNPLRDAISSSMMAGGAGAPDITTFDTDLIEWVEAGWLLPLDDALSWENFDPAVMVDGTYPDLGYPEHYKFDISTTVNMLLYNPELFAELGVVVPEDFQFTAEEFLNVVEQCSAAGYAGVANAVGDRPYPAVWAVQYPLFSLVGAEQFDAYNAGQQSWNTGEARLALEYSVQLRDAGLWPDDFSTMTIDEFHAFFHTQRQACMMFVPTWYTGRAFKSVAEGGQDPNWQFGMLRYPTFEDAAAPDSVWAGFESGYGVLSSTETPDVALDILAFAAQPQYGALWTAVTQTPSSILYDAETDWPSDALLAELGVVAGQWDWYQAEYDRVYGPLKVEVAAMPRCSDFDAAVVETLNEGLPLGLLDVDEAILILDEALCG